MPSISFNMTEVIGNSWVQSRKTPDVKSPHNRDMNRKPTPQIATKHRLTRHVFQGADNIQSWLSRVSRQNSFVWMVTNLCLLIPVLRFLVLPRLLSQYPSLCHDLPANIRYFQSCDEYHAGRPSCHPTTMDELVTNYVYLTSAGATPWISPLRTLSYYIA